MDSTQNSIAIWLNETFYIRLNSNIAIYLLVSSYALYGSNLMIYRYACLSLL